MLNESVCSQKNVSLQIITAILTVSDPRYLYAHALQRLCACLVVEKVKELKVKQAK